MRAAAEREGDLMAAKLQSKVVQMRCGLVKLARKRGVSKDVVKLMQSHQKMKQQTIHDTQYRMISAIVMSPSHMTLVKMTDAGVSLPKMKIRLDRGASDWDRCAKMLATEIGTPFLSVIKVDAAGPEFVVMSAADMAGVQNHAWLSVSRVLNSDLSARHKACVDTAIESAEQTAAKRVIRFNGVQITEEDSESDNAEHHWTRTDRGAGTYKGLITTDCAAPEWHMVTRRVTTDITTGKLLDGMSVADPLWFDASHMPRPLLVCNAKRHDIMTVLTLPTCMNLRMHGSSSNSGSDSSSEMDEAVRQGLSKAVTTDQSESDEARKRVQTVSAENSLDDPELQRDVHDILHILTYVHAAVI